MRDQAARLEKSIGDVGYVIAASVGLRAGFEEADGSEGSSSEVSVCNVQATNFVINQHENARPVSRDQVVSLVKTHATSLTHQT